MLGDAATSTGKLVQRAVSGVAHACGNSICSCAATGCNHLVLLKSRLCMVMVVFVGMLIKAWLDAA